MALKGKIYSIARQHDDLNTNELFQSMIDKSAAQDTIVMDGRNIAAGSIFAEQIHAGAITADKIRADAITADHMNVGSLSAISTNVGEITAGIIRSRDSGIHINLNTGIINLSKPLTINSKPVATSEQVTQAVDGVDDKVDALSTRVSNAEIKIEPSAIITTVTGHTTFKDVKEKAEAAKSTLDSKSSAWDAKATTGYVDGKAGTAETNAKNYAKKQVDDIEIGGRNLLTGTSNEWTELSMGTTWYVQFANPECILEVGTTYTFSIIVEKVSDDSIPISVHIGTGTTSYQKDISGWRRNGIPFGEKVTLTHTITEGDLGTHDGIFAWRLRNEQLATTIRFKEVKLEKGNKATDWTPAPEDIQLESDKKTYLPVRYIRDWQNGSTANSSCHWYEIEAYVNGENVARGKTASGPSGANRVTDGNRAGSYATGGVGKQYVQVDLGKIYYNVDSVGIWHYHNDGRTYKETMTEVSPDGINWYPIFDSAVEGEYETSAEGRVFPNTWARYEAVKTPIRLTERITTAEQKITDDAIRSTVTSSTTFKDVQSKANSAKETLDSKSGTWDAKATTGYVDGKAGDAESRAKTHADGKASTAEANAKKHAEDKIVEYTGRFFRAYAVGYGRRSDDDVPFSSGRIMDETGKSLISGDRSYLLTVIDRNDKIVHSALYDLHSSTNGKTIADNLKNKLLEYDKSYLVILIGSHAPSTNRLHNGLDKVLYNYGASPQVLKDEDWSSHPAYLLVGRNGIGEGNGYEVFSSASNGAMVDVIVPVKNGTTTLVSGDNAIRTLADSAKKTADTAIGDLGRLTSRVSTAEQKITDKAIISTVTESSTYKNEMTGKVSVDEIISRINQTAETISIEAKRVNLQGAVTFASFGTDVTSKLDDIESDASTAKSTASSAQSSASTAKSTADTANRAASEAKTTADTASSTASTAKTTANTASSVANTARSTANTANTAASNALTRVTIHDTRNDDQPPSWYFSNYARQIVQEFKYTKTMGIGTSLEAYGILLTTVPWSGSSGGSIKQEFKVQDRMYTRNGTTSSWTAWKDALGEAEAAKTSASNAQSTANAAKSTLDSKASTWDAKETTTGAQKKANDAATAAETAAKNHANKVSRLTVLDSTNKKFSNLAGVQVRTANFAGYLIIRTPITSSYMTKVKISGYNYLSNNTNIDLTIGFYAYSNSFLQHSFISNGDFPIEDVHLARDSSGRAVIIVGKSNTNWRYPSININEAQIGYTNPPDSYLDGWSVEFSTDISAYTSQRVKINGGDVSLRIDSADSKATNAKSKTDKWAWGNTTEIDGGAIRTNTITANQIEAKSITAEELNITTLSAITANLGTVTAGTIRSRDNAIDINLDTGTINLSRPLTVNHLPVSTKKEVEDAIQSIEIGGRNLVLNTGGKLYRTFGSGATLSEVDSATRLDWTGASQTSMGEKLSVPLIVGETYTLTFEARGTISPHIEIYILAFSGANLNLTDSLSDGVATEEFKKYTATFKFTGNPSDRLFIGGRGPAGTWLEIKDSTVKLEKGNIATDWTEAPEDAEVKIDEKLGDFVTVEDNSEELRKITTNLNDYLALVEQTKNSVNGLLDEDGNLELNEEGEPIQGGIVTELEKLLERAVGIENNLGEFTESWNFDVSQITMGEEGLFVGNDGSDMGILIAPDRVVEDEFIPAGIYFMDAGNTIAFISGQMMQINRGIFVQSAQIGEHKIETIAGGHTIFSWIPK